MDGTPISLKYMGSPIYLSRPSTAQKALQHMLLILTTLRTTRISSTANRNYQQKLIRWLLLTNYQRNPNVWKVNMIVTKAREIDGKSARQNLPTEMLKDFLSERDQQNSNGIATD